MRIRTWTDPNCPWAFSAEPFRLALRWAYADQIAWERAYVVISERIGEAEACGFTPDVEEAEDREIAVLHGMPLHVSARERITTSLRPALALVAARTVGDSAEERLLRALWVRGRSRGEPIDESEVIASAARDASLSPTDLLERMQRRTVSAQLRAEMRAARDPLPAALRLPHKLGAGARRYSSPTWVLEHRASMVAPGFQPLETYETLVANLAPELDRRDPPSSAAEVLRWSGYPLATVDVAAVMRVGRDAARRALAAASGRFQRAGTDGFWSPA